jgi:4'-phosphopantetheinyl transferase
MDDKLSLDIWQTPPDDLVLQVDDVHVWRVKVTDKVAPGGARGTNLSKAELDRANRFQFESDRDRFMVSRCSLREILSRYLDQPPAAIKFEHGEFGKPYIDSLPTGVGLSFNLSHSGEYILIAVGRNRKVGVDIEKIRPQVDLEGIARRFFSPNEVKSLIRFEDELRLEAFFRCWTRKEAYIKARGGGLSIPLDQFDVTLDPESPAELLATRDDPELASRWSLTGIDLEEGYLAALAVEGTPAEIFYFEYHSIGSETLRG